VAWGHLRIGSANGRMAARTDRSSTGELGGLVPVACTATLAGLGNEDLNVHLSVSGFALYQCQNGGGNTAPGQNRVLEGPATSDTAIPASAIKNGNLTFTTNPATERRWPRRWTTSRRLARRTAQRRE
jgi:hypothetical protein